LVVTDAFVRRRPARRHDGIFGSEPLPWPVVGTDRAAAGKLAG